MNEWIGPCRVHPNQNAKGAYYDARNAAPASVRRASTWVQECEIKPTKPHGVGCSIRLPRPLVNTRTNSRPRRSSGVTNRSRQIGLFNNLPTYSQHGSPSTPFLRFAATLGQGSNTSALTCRTTTLGYGPYSRTQRQRRIADSPPPQLNRSRRTSVGRRNRACDFDRKCLADPAN